MQDPMKLRDRFEYHKPTDHKIQAHQMIREDVWHVASTWDRQLPECRETSLALTKLEEAMFWANAAIARNV